MLGAVVAERAPSRIDLSPGADGFAHWACSELLGRKWTIEIVSVLLRGPHRFSGLRAAVPGLTEKTLSRRLVELQQADVVSRTPYAELPPRVDYALTPAGLGLRRVLREMDRWSRRFACPTVSGRR